ncbi:hypothetical protein [Dermatobacter hominis]|uniref:hypothetical protein n=1 Tax=Dermatobacter hominis TaxID=2884263 RepID=UPI001D12A5D6|nr:hypothetical protein [Dermatobacter hominis]UDY35180.1 hypothetical protein LH044_17795 [Dermatobacter hominis]
MAPGREGEHDDGAPTGPDDAAPEGDDAASEGDDEEVPEVPADRPDLEWDRVPDVADVHAAADDDLGEGAD